MRVGRFAHLIAAAASGGLLACASPVGPANPAPAVAGTANTAALIHTAVFDNCPWRLGDTGLRVIQGRAAWDRFVAEGQPSAEALQQWTPPLTSQWVVAYGTGFKPSSGHSLRMGVPVLTDAGRVVQLPIAVVSPASGTMQASVMTNPCAVGLLQLPLVGRLRLVDARSSVVLGEYLLQ